MHSRPHDDQSIARLLDGVVSSLGLHPDPSQMEQLRTHFALLLKWNEKINLTSIRDPAEIATRHFEESLFLAKLLPMPPGPLVDVGSGAGFPGLPLKVLWPSVETILLEPNNRKSTFLKEVIRSSGLEGIRVHAARLEDATETNLCGFAALVTMRAVAPAPEALANLRKLLAGGGRTALFVGEAAANQLRERCEFQWESPVAIPHSLRRVVLLGRIHSGS